MSKTSRDREFCDSYSDWLALLRHDGHRSNLCENSSVTKQVRHWFQRDGIGSEPASFQTPLIAPDIVGAQLCQTELSFLKFPADQDEALLFGFAQCLKACAFRGRLPIHAIGAVQQYHYLDNRVSPWLMQTAALRRFANPLAPLS
ncbi:MULTISPECIES: hypothetical protein [unclassified Rhizobium]|uniref:hypothetical protein n=1 Tax=unclassified Rhizobium TaxID=2613769 RepID=UPI00386CAD0D